VGKSIDESGYRRTGPLAQRPHGACGIARDHRILVSQRPSQCWLNRFRIGRQVDEGISGKAPKGDLFMPKQLDQQGNGRRTDLPDDFKRPLMQGFIVTGEESSQQR
jgi:hypothetical protein